MKHAGINSVCRALHSMTYLGVPINFQPAFYIHLVLLHASLALRVFADYANLHPLRMWGGLLNEVAILLFIGMTVYSVRRGPMGKV